VSAAQPGFRAIADALRETTERLAREIATPCADPPRWSEFEWSVARAVCAMQGISSLLATRLRWRGPAHWQDFLREQHQQTLACGERIGDLLGRLHEAARAAGLPVVALKGSAVRELALHRAGERPMGDIDLLVRPADMALAARVICSLGYIEACDMRRHVTFLPDGCGTPKPYGEHIDNPLRIELHQRVSEQLPVDTVDITASLWPSTTAPGINPYASFAALMRHLLLHAAGNMRANAMRFLQIYEISVCARRMTAEDWLALRGADPRRSAWWIFPALSMAERYFPGSVPGGHLEDFARACRPRLRARYRSCTVYEVSWSNLRIPALPGVEWARTWREALRFARSRALPKREALDDLAKGLATLPNQSSARWYRATHAERIVRWVFSRPPRVQTILTVRAALESASSARG
jgi:hypothetical protein